MSSKASPLEPAAHDCASDQFRRKRGVDAPIGNDQDLIVSAVKVLAVGDGPNRPAMVGGKRPRTRRKGFDDESLTRNA